MERLLDVHQPSRTPGPEGLVRLAEQSVLLEAVNLVAAMSMLQYGPRVRFDPDAATPSE